SEGNRRLAAAVSSSWVSLPPKQERPGPPALRHRSTLNLRHRRRRRPPANILRLQVFRFADLPPPQGGMDETLEQRMGCRRFRLELGMALHRQEPRMVAQLDHFDELAVGAGAGHLQAVGGELLAELIVELIAMAMTLAHHHLAVRLLRLASFHELAWIRSESHRAPLVGNRVLLVEHAHHGVTAIAVELGAIGVRQADHIAGELDDGTLQAQADAEERD